MAKVVITIKDSAKPGDLDFTIELDPEFPAKAADATVAQALGIRIIRMAEFLTQPLSSSGAVAKSVRIG